ncbi:hypothetical protein [Pseudomonas fontis]|uniref:PH domain-containing protein n=1 Tax=Pseudomonas fontis TaxID=2942633 RepID=A0ABT5NLB7_9PSED|nr:hypothetical protein [Pseudomonas fontis]MDD0974884.1 hypothetical protein [Pseudomonas fontis]MDD0989325.1 hypothetical protein [Pseudomonas fontis]
MSSEAFSRQYRYRPNYLVLIVAAALCYVACGFIVFYDDVHATGTVAKLAGLLDLNGDTLMRLIGIVGLMGAVWVTVLLIFYALTPAKYITVTDDKVIVPVHGISSRKLEVRAIDLLGAHINEQSGQRTLYILHKAGKIKVPGLMLESKDHMINLYQALLYVGRLE